MTCWIILLRKTALQATRTSDPGRTAARTGNIVSGAFTPVLAKHSKSFSLIDCVSVGVDRMQRNFEPMRNQVEAWQKYELTDVTAKVVIYEAFVEGKLEAPKHLARTVHDPVFRAKVRGVPVAHDLEPVESFHVGIQGARADPAVQSHSQAGRVPGDQVLAVVLARGGTGRPLLLYFPWTSRRCAEDDFPRVMVIGLIGRQYSSGVWSL